MAEIRLPNTSWFSYEIAPAGYRHRELAQQVLAHKITQLSKQLTTLLLAYQKDIDALEALQQSAARLDKRLNRLSPSLSKYAALKTQAFELSTAIKMQEKALLASKLPIKISEIRRDIRKISHQLGLPS